ncbi:Transcription factor lepE [Colletotrichum sidae]|uniref:Transcription factor lepE n=1 Tax=Colletotrichum sidae TaxID=1347389 RepID=A0A4V3I3A3_9PEZI|nr:Transcription factor lepE [Colletotrichum sidae]
MQTTSRATDPYQRSPIIFPGPTDSTGDHSGPADFGLWQPLIQPSAPQAKAGSSVRTDTVSTPASMAGSSSTVNSLVERVRQLEQQLSDLRVKNDDRPSAAATQQGEVMKEGLRYSRGCVSKTRFFGQSHWMNAADMLYRLISFSKTFQDDKTTNLYQGLEKCKNLARLIKSRRTPAFATISIGKSMPSRDVADALVDAYLRTFESVTRILHIPSFKSNYERYWAEPSEASESFVVLMQLCMAIGATFHDERFSLRNLAAQWFWEGMFWLMTPCEKSRMTMTGLQIRCLMHHLRHTANVGCDLSLIGAGSLVRTAMYMGMHRDPRGLVKMSPYRAEMRRRLWASILEIAVQSSIDAGGPPLISRADYDTEPPANLDDDQLVEDADSAFPVPKDARVFTQMTVTLALHETVAARLAVARRVNDFRSDTVYEETLRHSGELRAKLQRMMQQLKNHPISPFAHRYVQLMTFRFFYALHHPVVPLALRNPVYYFSRKMCVDTSLRLAEVAFLMPEKSPGRGAAKPTTVSELDFYRLTVNGAGTYRSVPFQAVMTLGLELIHQKEDEIKNGPSMSFSGAEIRGILDEATVWSRNRVRSGETNIKGHALSVLLVAHLEVLDAGINDERVEVHFEKACTERVSECYGLLRELAGDDVPDEAAAMERPDVHDFEMDFENGVDMLADWNFDDMENGGFISSLNMTGMDMILFP